MPLISVVISCYNDHEHLDEAIASVRAQKVSDCEIIVVNDGSSKPETLQALDQLPADVQVIHSPNKGLSGARNTGIAAASGTFIVTLDSDYRFAPAFFRKALGVFEVQPAVGVVTSYVQSFGASKKVWRSTASDDLSLLTENRIVACCAFRRLCWEQTGGYDENMRHGLEDWEFWIRVTRLGWKIHVIPEKLFFYRKKANSMLKDETLPRQSAILDYMMQKHGEWFLATLKKGILEKQLLVKKNLIPRRIAGLLLEKLRGRF